MTAAENLRAAADYIEEYGWFQGGYKDANGRVCMLGALAEIAPGQTSDGEEGFLEEVIGSPFLGLWNDVRHRTQDEVLDALRAAADLADTA